VSEVENEGMTFDQAKSELEGSAQQEAAAAQAVGPDNPELQQTAPEPTPGEAPELEGTTDPFTTPEVDEDSFTGPDFNPDLLPEDLQPGWKQLQAAFTRKTQELAEERKAYEALGSREELEQAREFYQSLQDPEYLQAFYGELGNVLQELGLSPEQAAAVAEEVAPPATPELPPEMARVAETDPELAPFIQEFANMRSELQEFKQQQEQQQQAMAAERQLMDQAAEIDRMVQVVRTDHPEYTEADWESIYDRAIAVDGDVLKAAELFQADKERILSEYLDSKETPQQVTPQGGAGVVTEDEVEAPKTLDQAQEQAEAFLAANDLQEFGG
jgi:hypothetical protein